jgi:hypothetical protein
VKQQEFPDSADECENDWAGMRGQQISMHFVVRRKAGKKTFEALRLARCGMLHRRFAEHQLFAGLNI